MPWRFCLPLLAVAGVAATGSHPLPVPGGGEALVLGSGQLNASHPMWEVQPHHWVTILTDMKVHAASLRLTGPGKWVVATGAAHAADPFAFHTAVDGLRVGPNLLLWVPAAHPSNLSALMVTRVDPPHPPVHLATRHSAIWLALPRPSPPFTGRWATADGPAAISDPASPTPLVSNLSRGRNQLQWTVPYGPHVATYTTVFINSEGLPGEEPPAQPLRDAPQSPVSRWLWAHAGRLLLAALLPAALPALWLGFVLALDRRTQRPFAMAQDLPNKQQPPMEEADKSNPQDAPAPGPPKEAPGPEEGGGATHVSPIDQARGQNQSGANSQGAPRHEAASVKPNEVAAGTLPQAHPAHKSTAGSEPQPEADPRLTHGPSAAPSPRPATPPSPSHPRGGPCAAPSTAVTHGDALPHHGYSMMERRAAVDAETTPFPDVRDRTVGGISAMREEFAHQPDPNPTLTAARYQQTTGPSSSSPPRSLARGVAGPSDVPLASRGSTSPPPPLPARATIPVAYARLPLPTPAAVTLPTHTLLAAPPPAAAGQVARPVHHLVPVAVAPPPPADRALLPGGVLLGRPVIRDQGKGA